MKVLRLFSGRGWFSVFLIVFLGVLLTACQTPPPDEGPFSAVPPGNESQTASASAAPHGGYSDLIRIGELVVVKFSGVDRPPPNHEERVKEDGTLTLPEIGSVKASDKSPGELQRELTEAYRKYFRGLVVTVVIEGRVYYVGGQVRTPGPKAYLGKTTVATAIQAAGDFTEFGNKKKVWLTRPGQKPVRVNVVEALKDPSKDLEVFPGDRIDVPRRWPG